MRHFLGKVFRPNVGLEEQAYIRLVEKGFVPAAIIDVGAYEGNWTRLAQRVFGDVPTLMIEAQAGKNCFLDKVCRDLPQARRVTAVLSAKSGENVTFFEMETGSSFLAERSNAPRTEANLRTRILDEVARDHIGAPLFLKIDVQGAELHVLAGGQETLARADLVQLEVAMLAYNQGAPTFLDVINYMDQRGFVPFDISGQTRLKGHLVQIDLLFTKRETTLRPSHITF